MVAFNLALNIYGRGPQMWIFFNGAPNSWWHRAALPDSSQRSKRHLESLTNRTSPPIMGQKVLSNSSGRPLIPRAFPLRKVYWTSCWSWAESSASIVHWDKTVASWKSLGPVGFLSLQRFLWNLTESVPSWTVVLGLANMLAVLLWN